MRNWLLLALLSLIGCSGSTNTREVTGRLTAGSYGLDNPVVVAESSDHHVFVASVSKNGSFRLLLPAGVAYRMTLANSTRSAGVYQALARVNWPLASGSSRWANLSTGGSLDLGQVAPRSQSASSAGLGIQCDSCSGGGSDGGSGDGSGDYKDDDSDKGDCHEDDGAKTPSSGGEGDCDCSHKVSSSDGCDQDGDADQHDHDCDKDDDGQSDDGDKGGNHYGSGDHDGDHEGSHQCDGGSSSGGSVASGTPGASGDSCQVSADCASGLSCTNNACGASGTVK